MLALVATPGMPGSTVVQEVPDAQAGEGEVLLRTVRVGVCGTDREISEGLFGVAPDGEQQLVLGHELLARVESDAHGFRRGELVSATVRRSCGHCAACAAGAPDACMTGDYLERGITRLAGFASELVAERPEHLVRVPEHLAQVAVLAEPTSVCVRGLRHARTIGERQPWTPTRALVLGTGAIGMLTTYLLRLEGVEVWTAGRAEPGSHQAELVERSGARYVPASACPPAQLAADVGGFDVVMECAGDAQLMLDALGFLRRGGVACLLGIDGRPATVALAGPILGVDAILQNRALVGSVNANHVDWTAGVQALGVAHERWPGALESFVELEVPVDRFAEAFAHRGVKATLSFGEGSAYRRQRRPT